MFDEEPKITDLELNEEQQRKVLQYLAYKYWNLLIELKIQDGICKSYDPLTIDGNIAHTYVFDLDDGGRHHQFRDLLHLEDMLDREIKRELKNASSKIL